MAKLKEVPFGEMIRGPFTQELYPYPEKEKPYPVVILDTTMGDMTFEFFFKEAPKTCRNFLEHSRSGYYEPVIFHRIQKNFWVQAGDPTSTGRGGKSIYGRKVQDRPTFEDEYSSHLKHNRAGLVSMANSGSPGTNGSQFFITLAPCPWLDGKHTIFARVTKGMNVLKRMNILEVDKNDRPLEHVKLVRTLVIERARHFEWRPHAEKYGCCKSKGSQLAHEVDEYIAPDSGIKIKRMSADWVWQTRQGDWF